MSIFNAERVWGFEKVLVALIGFVNHAYLNFLFRNFMVQNAGVKFAVYDALAK
jgi:hypothetical protein